jgi:hypothetical protein
LGDAIGNPIEGHHPMGNIPPPGDSDPGNPLYTFDTSDLFNDFDAATFHIFLQMVSRFCIYKPDSISIDQIKQIWRISDYFDIPTLLLNEDDLVSKIRSENMATFEGIQSELDFALRYNWRKLRDSALAVLNERTCGLGGLMQSMKDAEIMETLRTMIIAERRKTGVEISDEEEDRGLESLRGVRWTTPSENERSEMDDLDDDEYEETTMVDVKQNDE